jgi:hypothetical protein
LGQTEVIISDKYSNLFLEKVRISSKLFRLWEYFQKGMEQDEIQETADVTMQHGNNPLEPSRKFLEIHRLNHERKMRLAADHDRNLESRTPKEYDSRKCLQAVSRQDVSNPVSVTACRINLFSLIHVLLLRLSHKMSNGFSSSFPAPLFKNFQVYLI